MTTTYDRRKAGRQADNERRLMGETLAEYRARLNPAPTTPGAHLPKVKCRETFDLFKETQPQLFDTWRKK